MKKFFSFLIRQSVAILLAVAFVLGIGVYCTLKMSVNLLPDINVPMVCAQVIYPGANALSVEKDVTVKLEEGLSSLSGVTGVDSYSYDNVSAVVLSFDYGADTSGKKSEMTDKIRGLELPDDVSVTVYDIDLNAEALATLSLTSEAGPDDAHAKAEVLSARLAAIDGVEKVEIKGGADYSYYVRPYGGLELIVPLLVEAFSYGALDLPLGNIGDDGVQIRNNSDVSEESDIFNAPLQLPVQICNLFAGIRAQVAAQLKSLLNIDINDAQTAQSVVNNPLIFPQIVSQIHSRGGENLSEEVIKLIVLKPFEADKTMLVSVGDVASIGKEAQYAGYAYYYDGGLKLTEGMVVEVYKSNGANSSAVVDEVKSVCKELSSAESFGAKISLLDDQSQFISDSISNVLISMIIGGVLAVIIIYLFLKKVRTSLIIAVTMPLSVLAALICLFLMGITLNMVSLGGLAVGIGMLVDNSIVVIESITKHRDKGKSAFNAAVDGTVEVGGALLGSTLTTVCVFVPIIFTGGLTAEIFTDLSFAVIFSLAFSLIVAVTVIPALYALLCGGRKPLTGSGLSPQPPQPAEAEATAQSRGKRFGRAAEIWRGSPVMNRVTACYGKILPKVLAHKAVTIITAIAVFGASIGLLFLTGTEFLPSVDKGQIEINMSYGGARLETVQEDVLEFSGRLADEVEEVDYLSVSVGKNGLLALTDTGVITVQLKKGADTDKAVKRIRALASEPQNKPLAFVTVRKIDGVVASLTSGSSDMSVNVVGEDENTLAEISEKIKSKLGERGFTEISDTATQETLQYTIEVDRAALAEKLGADAYQTLILTLRIGLASYSACSVTIGGESYVLNVAFAKDAVGDKQSLENFTIGMDAEGNTVALKDVLKGGAIKEEYVKTCIRRADGKSVISVSATLEDTDTGEAGKQMRAAAEEVLKEYDGYSFESSGISAYLNDAFEGLAVALVISFFLLYAVMAIQFGSALKSLVIMASIPFCFTGGFIALVITGTSLNVVSFIGLIMLMGVVVNNAIVMLEKIKQLKDEGMPHFNAVCEACKQRLRPILMTTLTTVLALIPLAVGIGSGSELMQPLGIVVIGGLLLGTLVTLALVPAVYCAVHRISPGGKGGEDKSAAPEKTECAACDPVAEARRRAGVWRT